MTKEALSQLELCGLIPVAVIEDAQSAVPAARAILSGGLHVMEITFRTAAAARAIRAVAEHCPDILVGAGTVVTPEQCRQAVEMGAKFIVSPGFSAPLVRWCADSGVAVVPGCVTPSEIMAAMEMGVEVVKFFPANVYGGLSALSALSAPFGGVKFIPTGGISAQNVGEYIAAPFIHAVGGSWICRRDDILSGRFARITALCAEARQRLLGYEAARVEIRTADAQSASDVLRSVFGLAAEGSAGVFSAPDAIPVTESRYTGSRGHIAVRTNRIAIAIADLEKKGFPVDTATAQYRDGRMSTVYLKDEIDGFAIHLLQK